jgi:hypothetical protein
MVDPIKELLKQENTGIKKPKIDNSLDAAIKETIRQEKRIIPQKPAPEPVQEPIEVPTPQLISNQQTNNNDGELKVYPKGNVINVNNAYDDSVKLVKQKLKKDNIDISNILETVTKEEIVVVKGY